MFFKRKKLEDRLNSIEKDLDYLKIQDINRLIDANNSLKGDILELRSVIGSIGKYLNNELDGGFFDTKEYFRALWVLSKYGE